MCATAPREEGHMAAVNETIDAPIEYIYVLIRETPGAHHIKAGNALPDWVPPDGAK